MKRNVYRVWGGYYTRGGNDYMSRVGTNLPTVYGSTEQLAVDRLMAVGMAQGYSLKKVSEIKEKRRK